MHGLFEELQNIFKNYYHMQMCFLLLLSIYQISHHLYIIHHSKGGTQKSYSTDLIHYGLSAFNHLLILKVWNFEEDWQCKLRQCVTFCIQKKKLLEYSGKSKAVVNRIVVSNARILQSFEAEQTLSCMEHRYRYPIYENFRSGSIPAETVSELVC